MRIAITGGTGFIGSHLVNRLSMEHKVLALERALETPLPGSRANGVTFQSCDILNAEKLAELTAGCDCIVHLAGLRSMKESMQRPLDYNKTNIDGTVNALEAARINNIKKFVFASSSSVYGNDPRRPIREDAPLNPSNPYGVSKLAGEKYCRLYFENFGLEAVSLRVFNVYGPGQEPTAGVISAFVAAVMQGSRPILHGSGPQSLDFVFVSDVADAFERAIVNSRKASGLAFNVASGKNYSVEKILSMLENILGKKISPIRILESVHDSKSTLADISLAKHILGWRPKYDIKEGLEKTIAWFAARHTNDV